ncbi:MAG: hypothetical protein J3R72DRAFT_486010 [Linnemannia gamsii]|nr:MAG: hypothetical protein J3R72DRAFT_486010 [Linnemannia gamsii]
MNIIVHGNKRLLRSNAVAKAAVSSDIVPFCMGYASNPVRIRIFRKKLICAIQGWATLFTFTAHTKKGDYLALSLFVLDMPGTLPAACSSPKSLPVPMVNGGPTICSTNLSTSTITSTCSKRTALIAYFFIPVTKATSMDGSTPTPSNLAAHEPGSSVIDYTEAGLRPVGLRGG